MKPRSECDTMERPCLTFRGSAESRLERKRDGSLSATARLQPAPILFATRLGERAPAAMRVVAAMSEQFSASLHLLHGVEPPFFMHGINETIALRPVAEWVPDAERKLGSLAERTPPDTEATCHVRVGVVARKIATVAEELNAGLVIINMTARGPLARWWLGSSTHKIVRLVRRPVLIIPNECLN